MPPKSQKRKLGSKQDEVLDALNTSSSTSITKKQRNTSELISQHLQKNKIFTNTSEKLPVDTDHVLGVESSTVNKLLEITNKILTQSTLIIEKQEALEATVTQLSSDIKTLQSSYENLKSKTKDDNNWLYSNDKICEKFIQKELEELCPNKIEWCKKNSKWEALYSKIKNSISAESCRYRSALFGSFHCAVFEHVFKNKVLPKVNLESSEANIISWKSSKAHIGVEMITKKVQEDSSSSDSE
ncbi:2945_t:CDS:2 [Gigaspora margarita]|uniref:2945_t:CDS:1 n=1 Tax=Gigaspora margarita TaxID=4874 RepID=A0ABN7WBX0_GIGMA|nr:2945_t:CDS:2 [Gigaspora margarita]